jgi:DNA polymerase III sliding clamp (beta) subunit (PCNA family)
MTLKPPSPKGGYRHAHRADIPESSLTFREKRVLAAIRAASAPLTVHELSRECFPGFRAKPGTYEGTTSDGETVRHATAPAYRAVLNSLRRLVAGSYVEKVDRGTYAVAQIAAPAVKPAAAAKPAPATKAAPIDPPPPPTTPPTRAPTARAQPTEARMLASKGVLFTVLTQLYKVADRHSSMPALSHVRVDATDGAARFTTTDLTTTLTTTIPAEGAFDACLPAKPLLDFVKPTDRADRDTLVEFKLVENANVVIATDGAMTTLASLPAKEFPLRPGDKHLAKEWKEQATWPAADFAEKLGWVLLAVGVDETRRHLCGVYFDADRVVALDGHRLHLAALHGMAAGPTLVAGKSIAALLGVVAMRGDIAVSRAKDVLRFTVGQWQLETVAMTEKFPPYDQVVPSDGSETFHAAIGREGFSKALAKLPKPGRHRPANVRMKWNGQLVLERDSDSGTSSSSIPLVETTHTGEEFVIGVNAKYLVDALADGDETITARFSDPLSPIRIDIGADRFAVVMPMRL